MIREQIWQVRCEGPVRRADVLVGEVPLRLAVLKGRDSFLADEILPTSVPCAECCREGRFVGSRERMHERKECFAGVRLGTAREIPPDDLDLMELADLHRHILKNLDESSSSVDHGRFQYPAPLFKDSPSIAVVGHELARDFVPPNVLGKRPRAEDAHAIVATPEGGVGDDNRWMRY